MRKKTQVVQAVNTVVLDTNVLLGSPESIHSFEQDTLVIIPLIVLEELDRHKTRQDEVGKNARIVCRMLDELRLEGNGNLTDGIKLISGSTLKVSMMTADAVTLLPPDLQTTKNDNIIIAFMLQLKKMGNNATLISRDINVRIKCDSLGIKCSDYTKLRVTSDVHDFYKGVVTFDVSEKIISDFYTNNSLPVSEFADPSIVFPNQIVILKCPNASGAVITKCVIFNDTKIIQPIRNSESAFGLKPKNKEQQFSLDLLYDTNIKLCTLTGIPGSGKTLLALAAAMDQLVSLGSKPTYDKMIVMRPVQPVGKDIGYLPGTLQEKMEPWIAPIRDNLNFLMGHQKEKPRKQFKGRQHGHVGPDVSSESYLSLMQERGIIEVEAITFIRGRSIPNAFIIVDEAQNLSVHELKTIITRVGHGTKVVLTGDIEQIDNVHVDMFTNGLTYAIEKFKDQEISGHVTLQKGERSRLASVAAKIL